ncbi:MAG: hypothetical protein HZY73_07840 [Micropruina sp.]|nr:MAG: hypothetical protein HZY73_07840 [Micropruina sp.]
MYVHATIGMIATDAQGASLDALDGLVADALRVVVVGRENGNLPRARARMSGLVHQYVRVFLPPPGTEFHGTEVPVPRGRADLLWWHPAQGWFFDEVKTFRFAGEDDLDYRAQVTKYLNAGAALDGDFAGVRLISLGNTQASRLYSPTDSSNPCSTARLPPTNCAHLLGERTSHDQQHPQDKEGSGRSAAAPPRNRRCRPKARHRQRRQPARRVHSHGVSLAR